MPTRSATPDDPDATGAPLGAERALLRAGILLIATSYGLARYAYGFFVPTFRDEFGLDAALIGVIAAGSYASYCIAIVVSTLLVPRVGARVVAVSAGALAAVGIVIVALAPNAVVVAVGILVAGASTGMSSPPLADAVSRTARTSSRDRVQTVINSSTGIGIAVIAPVALLAHDDWRTAWAAFAVMGAATAVFVAFSVPSAPRSRRAHIALVPRPLLPAGSGRLLGAAAILGIASSAILTFGRDVLVTVGQMSETASTTAWVLMGAAGTLGVTAGDLGRRLGLRRAWLGGMLLMGSATVLLAALPDVDVLAWVAIATFGAVYMTLSGLLLVWSTRVYALSPATGVGLAFLVTAIGQAVASAVVGALVERFDVLTAFGVAAGTAVVGAVLRPRAPRSVAPDGIHKRSPRP